jgi:serine/threonine-protein kinase RsbW
MRPGSLSTKLHVQLGETQLVSKIVHEFGKWHNVPQETIFVIKLSLDEVVTNIVTHSPKRPPGAREIVIRLSTVDGQIQAEVEDDGGAFNPLALPPPDIEAPLQDRDPGGLGIHLVRSLMDDVNYCRIGRRNRFTMTKRVA